MQEYFSISYLEVLVLISRVVGVSEIQQVPFLTKLNWEVVWKEETEVFWNMKNDLFE